MEPLFPQLPWCCWRALRLIVKKCGSVRGVCCHAHPLLVIAWHNLSEKHKLKCNSCWWLLVLHIVFFCQRSSAVSPFLLSLWPMGEVIIISTCLSSKTRGLLVLQTRPSSSLHMRWQSLLSPQQEAETFSCCWMQSGRLPPATRHLIYIKAHILDGISMCGTAVCLQLQNSVVSRKRGGETVRADTCSTMLTKWKRSNDIYTYITPSTCSTSSAVTRLLHFSTGLLNHRKETLHGAYWAAPLGLSALLKGTEMSKWK